MPLAKTTEDYMSTEGAQSAVKVVQEKMDAGSSAEDVVRSLADSGLRVYSESDMDEYTSAKEEGTEAVSSAGPEAMMEKPETEETEETEGSTESAGENKGESKKPNVMILAIRSALEEDKKNKEAKKKEAEY